MYDFAHIEKKWQALWKCNNVFKISSDFSILVKKKKFYILDMFPYPSGDGLHVGHLVGYTATDVISRFKRMAGFNVLHPMGWDSFGLPTERAAIRESKNPYYISERNIKNFKIQIEKMGYDYNWELEINTSDPYYFKWTQWIFLKLFEKKLAYYDYVFVNWCPKLKTVLSNEEVTNKKYTETGDEVKRKLMKQWILKITEYSQRLLDDLMILDWPESIKKMQINWIGKKTGIFVNFFFLNFLKSLKIFLSDPKILNSNCFCLVSYESKIIKKMFFENSFFKKDNIKFLKNIFNNSIDSLNFDNINKNCFFSGLFLINPLINDKIPIFISNYFSNNFNEIIICSFFLNFLNFFFYKKNLKITTLKLYNKNYKNIKKKFFFFSFFLFYNFFYNYIFFLGNKFNLKDWIFSRQRLWGEPIPIFHCVKKNFFFPFKDSELPLKFSFQNNSDFDFFLNKKDLFFVKNKELFYKEINTMPQWAGSCWYFLRYIDSKNNNFFVSQELENYWMPVDLYIGGAEHAVLHLLYSRFWYKVLFDLNLVKNREPFTKLFNPGLVLYESYSDVSGKYFHKNEVYKKGDSFFLNSNNKLLINKLEKMSKSKYNVINPNEILNNYGADCLRIYELFLGPLNKNKIWSDTNLIGISRFLNKVWNFSIEYLKIDINIKNNIKNIEDDLKENTKILIKKTELYINELKFNVAISGLMSYFNYISKKKKLHFEYYNIFLKLLSPFAPHISEELWSLAGNKEFISTVDWPDYKSIEIF